MNWPWSAKAPAPDAPERDSTANSTGGTSWKEWAGRDTGDDGYRFFDFSRALGRKFLGRGDSTSFSTLANSEDRDSLAVTAVMSQSDPLFTGIQDLQAGFDALAKAGIRHGTDELEAVGQAISELKQRIEEAALWSRRCQGFGELLSVQLCSATGDEEPPDWSMGLFFLSTKGIYFESNEAPPWGIGPITFDSITRVEKVEKMFVGGASASCDIRLELKDGAVHVFSGIRDLNQILTQGNLELSEPLSNLKDFIGMGSLTKPEGEEMPAAPTKSRLPPGRGSTAEPSPGAPQGLSPQESSEALECWMDQWADGADTVGGAKSMAGARSVAAPPTETVDASPRADTSRKTTTLGIREAPTVARKTLNAGDLNLQHPTESFMIAADNLPEAEAPQKLAPVFTADLPALTIEKVTEVLSLQNDWPVQKSCWTTCTDIKSTPWADSRRVAKTKMRRFQFRMPLPPAPMCPSSSSMTVLCRLGCSERRVVLVQEACTHEVPYGENFLVQDITVFQILPSGGVSMQKYASVKWVSNLPFIARWMKPIIESQSKGGSKEAAEKLEVYLRTLK